MLSGAECSDQDEEEEEEGRRKNGPQKWKPGDKKVAGLPAVSLAQLRTGGAAPRAARSLAAFPGRPPALPPGLGSGSGPGPGPGGARCPRPGLC